MSESPQLILIAGPNGAGKSTLAPHLLRDVLGINEFVNADKIAEGLSGYSPEHVAIDAGAIMLQRVYDLTESHRSFAIETTLAGRSWLNLIRKSRQEYRYQVTINFIWVKNVQLCIDRVKHRQ
ncbi:MAG: zeta toxin family protein [Planctomycetaceae bacterium]|nr:zeta toxin family protein [Planctomycetaceae bacterium]